KGEQTGAQKNKQSEQHKWPACQPECKQASNHGAWLASISRASPTDRMRLVGDGERIAQEYRALGRDQLADLRAFKDLSIAAILLPHLDRPPGEAASVGRHPDGHGAIALAHDAIGGNPRRALGRPDADDE